MKVSTLIKIFYDHQEQLNSNQIRSIYLYGSQVTNISNKEFIPKGKEIDLLFIKEGFLKDGNPPITKDFVKDLISNNYNNVIIRFNGIWEDISFSKNYYYFDITGNGTENIKTKSASTKVTWFKHKKLLWGSDSFCGISNVMINKDDISELISTMSKYVKREFFEYYTTANFKGIYKNALFLLSILDINLLPIEDKDILKNNLLTSNKINISLKECIINLSNSYYSRNFQDIKNNFSKIIEIIQNEYI